MPVKTPAMLAEVCTAARDHDGAVDVTLTTGSLNRRDRGALYISKCATAIKEACGLPVQVQFEPPDDLSVLDEVHAAGVDAVGMHLETFDPEVLARVAPGQGADGHRRLLPRLGARGRGLRARAREHLRDPRHGRGPRPDRGGLPARDRDGRLPLRRAAAPGARHAHGRRRRRRRPTTWPRSTARCRRCWPTPASITPTRAPAARAARRARGCRRGSASSRRSAGVSSPTVGAS